MKEILLTQGQVALVDDWNYERVNQYKWYATRVGETFYAVRWIKLRSAKDAREIGLPRGGKIQMHRFIMNTPQGMETDHVNHNPLDNQEHNLRNCTHIQNIRNQFYNKGTSKYKGVTWHKYAKKWMASIRRNGESVHLGYFSNEGEAAKAYDAKAVELFGEFAFPNFPERVFASIY